MGAACASRTSWDRGRWGGGERPPGGGGRGEGGVAVAGRAVAAEDELEGRLDLVLAEPRRREAHGLGVRLPADLAGAALRGRLGGQGAGPPLVGERAGGLGG